MILRQVLEFKDGRYGVYNPAKNSEYEKTAADKPTKSWQYYPHPHPQNQSNSDVVIKKKLSKLMLRVPAPRTPMVIFSCNSISATNSPSNITLNIPVVQNPIKNQKYYTLIRRYLKAIDTIDDQNRKYDLYYIEALPNLQSLQHAVPTLRLSKNHKRDLLAIGRYEPERIVLQRIYMNASQDIKEKLLQKSISDEELEEEIFQLIVKKRLKRISDDEMNQMLARIKFLLGISSGGVLPLPLRSLPPDLTPDKFVDNVTNIHIQVFSDSKVKVHWIYKSDVNLPPIKLAEGTKQYPGYPIVGAIDPGAAIPLTGYATHIKPFATRGGILRRTAARRVRTVRELQSQRDSYIRQQLCTIANNNANAIKLSIIYKFLDIKQAQLTSAGYSMLNRYTAILTKIRDTLNLTQDESEAINWLLTIANRLMNYCSRKFSQASGRYERRVRTQAFQTAARITELVQPMTRSQEIFPSNEFWNKIPNNQKYQLLILVNKFIKFFKRNFSLHDLKHYFNDIMEFFIRIQETLLQRFPELKKSYAIVRVLNGEFNIFNNYKDLYGIALPNVLSHMFLDYMFQRDIASQILTFLSYIIKNTIYDLIKKVQQSIRKIDLFCFDTLQNIPSDLLTKLKAIKIFSEISRRVKHKSSLPIKRVYTFLDTMINVEAELKSQLSKEDQKTLNEIKKDILNKFVSIIRDKILAPCIFEENQVKQLIKYLNSKKDSNLIEKITNKYMLWIHTIYPFMFEHPYLEYFPLIFDSAIPTTTPVLIDPPEKKIALLSIRNRNTLMVFGNFAGTKQGSKVHKSVRKELHAYPHMRVFDSLRWRGYHNHVAYLLISEHYSSKLAYFQKMPPVNTKKDSIESAVIRKPRDTLTVKEKYILNSQISDDNKKIHSDLSGSYKISQKYCEPRIPLLKNAFLILDADKLKEDTIEILPYFIRKIEDKKVYVGIPRYREIKFTNLCR